MNSSKIYASDLGSKIVVFGADDHFVRSVLSCNKVDRGEDRSRVSDCFADSPIVVC